MVVLRLSREYYGGGSEGGVSEFEKLRKQIMFFYLYSHLGRLPSGVSVYLNYRNHILCLHISCFAKHSMYYDYQASLWRCQLYEVYGAANCMKCMALPIV